MFDSILPWSGIDRSPHRKSVWKIPPNSSWDCEFNALAATTIRLRSGAKTTTTASRRSSIASERRTRFHVNSILLKQSYSTMWELRLIRIHVQEQHSNRLVWVLNRLTFPTNVTLAPIWPTGCRLPRIHSSPKRSSTVTGNTSSPAALSNRKMICEKPTLPPTRSC